MVSISTTTPTTYNVLLLLRVCLALLCYCPVSFNPQAFVQFADVPSAQRAKDAISGRMFAGSIVQAYHVTPNVYQAVPDSH